MERIHGGLVPLASIPPVLSIFPLSDSSYQEALYALAFHSWFTRYPNEVIPTYSHPFSSTRTRPSYIFGSADVQSFAQ